MARRSLKLFAFVVFGLVFSACLSPERPDPCAVPPLIVAFYPWTPTINKGESGQLFYSVRNAAAISIDQGVGPTACWGVCEITNYDLAVHPTVTTTYTLTATNSYGTDTALTTITVK